MLKNLRGVKMYQILHNKNRYFYIIIFLIILFIREFYSFCYIRGFLYIDSYSYINYDFLSIMKGKINNGRTPVYPIIIKTMIMLFGELGGVAGVVVFQKIVSFVSVIYLYKIIMLLTKHLWIAYFFVFLYGISPTICGWDYVILTESLALSGTVFFIYYIFMYIKLEEKRYGKKLNILLIILCFLRPTFLLFEIILFVFLLIRVLLKKKNTIPVLYGCVFAWIIIFIYSGLFYKSYGIFSISDPMPRQFMFVCIEREYYKNSSDEKFIDLVEQSLEEVNNNLWEVTGIVLSNFGLANTEKIAKECIKNNFCNYLNDEIKLIFEVLGMDFYSYAIDREDISVSAKNIRNILEKGTNIIRPIHGILLALAVGITAIFDLVKKKKVCWISVGLFTFIYGIFLSTVFLTCGEYIRTMIHIIPFLYIAIAFLIAKYIYMENEFIDYLRGKIR